MPPRKKPQPASRTTPKSRTASPVSPPVATPPVPPPPSELDIEPELSQEPAIEPQPVPEVAQSTAHTPSTPTQAVPIPVAVDIGNHQLKVAQGNQVRIIDSLYAEVLHRSRVGELDDSSALVTYLDGDCSDLIGKQWLVGHDAQTYFPDTFQSAIDLPNNRGKVDLGLQLLLGFIAPPLMGDRLIIKYLFASLPDVKVLGSSFIQAIQGTHTIEQVTAQYTATFTVEIQHVVLKEEGQGAIAYALSKGLCVQGAWNATIDFGGGTTITQAYNERGQIVPASRLVQTKGVSDLINAIASDERFRLHLGKYADPALILEGMRDGQFKYGGQGFDFSDIYQDHHRAWLPSVARPAIKKLTALQDRLKTILLIGGGANLAKSLVRDSVVLCDRPDVVNVEGLMILAKIRMSDNGGV